MVAPAYASERWWVEPVRVVGWFGLPDDGSNGFGLDLVSVAGGCGPHETAGFGLVESPPA
jgi:hypothetical protein